MLTLYSEGGGLHQSRLIEKHLIDVYVPFLPMEKIHVRLCAENEFNKQKYFPRNKEAALQWVWFIAFAGIIFQYFLH